jgi:hypothetical protein
MDTSDFLTYTYAQIKVNERCFNNEHNPYPIMSHFYLFFQILSVACAPYLFRLIYMCRLPNPLGGLYYQCLSTLKLCVRIPLMAKVCQWLETGRWFSLGTPVSSNSKTLPLCNWNTVERGVKHHKPPKYSEILNGFIYHIWKYHVNQGRHLWNSHSLHWGDT